MNISSHYWFKYKELENKLAELTNIIHFNDTQLSTYSFYLADLILQVSSEYESIANDLYLLLDGSKRISTTGARIMFLNKKLQLEKKEIAVTCPNMYFLKRFSRYFRPYGYKDDGPNDIYKNYNALKHYRLKNIQKASIKNLLLVLAALYILILYYYGADGRDLKSYDSQLFRAKVAGVTIGVLLDFGVGLKSELDSSVLFEQVNFDYYVFGETHRGDIYALIADSRYNIGNKELIKTIKQQQYDMVNTIKEILYKNRPDLPIGEIINETLRLSGNYFADSSNLARRANLGYSRIYIPIDKMSATHKEILKYAIADIV